MVSQYMMQKRVWYAEISIPAFFILWGEIKKYETEQESEKYRREPDHRGCDLEAASDILFSDLVWNSVPADL